MACFPKLHIRPFEQFEGSRTFTHFFKPLLLIKTKLTTLIYPHLHIHTFSAHINTRTQALITRHTYTLTHWHTQAPAIPRSWGRHPVSCFADWHLVQCACVCLCVFLCDHKPCEDSGRDSKLPRQKYQRLICIMYLAHYHVQCLLSLSVQFLHREIAQKKGRQVLGCCFDITGLFLFTFNVILNRKSKLNMQPQPQKHVVAHPTPLSLY
jgi:hypothetical protein